MLAAHDYMRIRLFLNLLSFAGCSCSSTHMNAGVGTLITAAAHDIEGPHEDANSEIMAELVELTLYNNLPPRTLVNATYPAPQNKNICRKPSDLDLTGGGKGV